MDSPNTQSKLPEFHFDEFTREVYRSFPFLGYIVVSLRRRQTTAVPIAAINAQNELFYNLEAFQKASDDDRTFFLLHEVLHRSNNHFIRADQILLSMFGVKNFYVNDCKNKKKDSGFPLETWLRIMQLQDILNIAMDCSINQIIDKKLKIPKGLVTLKLIQDMVDDAKLNIKVEPMKEFEYYFDVIMHIPNVKNMLDNMKDLADKIRHGLQYSDGSSAPSDGKVEKAGKELADQITGGEFAEDYTKSSEQAGEELKHIIRKAGEKQREHEIAKGIGKESGNSWLAILPDLSVKINDKHIWEGLINKAFGDMLLPEYVGTLRRPSRRDESNPWGRKRPVGTKQVIVCVDTSSSITHSMVAKFFGAINRALTKYNVTVDLLLTNVSVYKEVLNLRHLSADNIEIIDGGTDLTTAQKWVMEHKPNHGKGQTLVTLTDGYTGWLEKVPFNQSVIYTPQHSKLEGISNWAVIDDDNT